MGLGISNLLNNHLDHNNMTTLARWVGMHRNLT